MNNIGRKLFAGMLLVASASSKASNFIDDDDEMLDDEVIAHRKLLKKRRKTRQDTNNDTFCHQEWIGDCIGACSTDIQFNRMHLVLSHCSHDLNWLDNYVNVSMFDTITIASKCGLVPESAPINAKMVQLANVGRCDHTYSQWMMQNVEALNDDDFVLFMKDTHNIHQVGQFRAFEAMLRVTKTNGFACGLRPNGGFSVFHNVSALHKFTFKGHSFNKYFKNEQERQIFESKLNFSEWAQKLEMNVSAPIVPVCYNGVFSTLGISIKKQQNVWPKLTESLQRADSIEEGHFAERTWASLLHFDLPSSVLLELKNRSNKIICDLKSPVIGRLVGCNKLKMLK